MWWELSLIKGGVRVSIRGCRSTTVHYLRQVCGWGRIVLYWLARNNTRGVSGDTEGGESKKGDGEGNGGGKG